MGDGMDGEGGRGRGDARSAVLRWQTRFAMLWHRPLLLGARLSEQRATIEADVGRWFEIRQPGRYRNRLLYLLATYPEFPQPVLLPPAPQPGACPVIGDGVAIHAGAKVLGRITLGDGARVGANAVVLTDVPPCSVAVGVPARIIGPAGGQPPESRTTAPVPGAEPAPGPRAPSRPPLSGR